MVFAGWFWSGLAVLVAGAAVAEGAGAAEGLPRPSFYLPFDGSATAAIARGDRAPRSSSYEDAILEIVDGQRERYPTGKVGRCCDVTRAPLLYGADANFSAAEGSCSFWISPHFRGDDTNCYATFFGAGRWGMLYKYQSHSALSFGTAKPAGDLFYDCSARELRSWKPDEWHHVAVTWSKGQNSRRIYLDGALAAKAPYPHQQDAGQGPLYVGGGCDLYPQYCAQARLDEFALWDRALEELQIQRLFRLGSEAKPLWPSDAAPAQTDPQQLRVFVPATALPAPRQMKQDPERLTAPSRRAESPTRRSVLLSGWWHFLPMQELASELPREGWGAAHVPGYWTGQEDVVDPAGRPARGAWRGTKLSEFEAGYLVRGFRVDPQWKGRRIVLHLDGVDGLADLYLNGQRLARLGPWEDESYEISSRVRFDQENVLAIALQMRGRARLSGIYGDLSIRAVPDAFIDDLVVQPSVQNRQIRFSCNVWSLGKTSDAAMEFIITPADRPKDVVKVFRQGLELQPAGTGGSDVTRQAQRVECAFAWDDPRLWTYDDPCLYRVQARLSRGGRIVDECPAVRFGFREFSMRAGDLLLNGKPTHLRGHQIDFGWPDQRQRVKELKAAGMNSFELSGPVRCGWHFDAPYRLKEFEDVLDYADEQGLVAIPILPDAMALREQILRPEVQALYARRVEKHIRRFGQHPSIGLWYMHFNLAGYMWYVCPTKIDGSHKPDAPGFQQKERYAMAAQRIAQKLDPRPIYHHACGNLGDIFTTNCYIGPNSPLQEREEWPLRWAQKRPFPLIACEHDLMLICYWFRPRQFPLSVVYAGEPIFDEVAAMYLGPDAYRRVTPELFDLYDMDRAPRPTRFKTLVREHPGYQEVGALFARHSLRAWRTYGVSGILFNAINWDYFNGKGEPQPVLNALGRYFNDVDLYVAGPGEDWPSKDHSYFAGEIIRKQIVLLNDLTRDLPCRLEWLAVDAAGTAYASGLIQTTARAGVPARCGIEFKAPAASARQEHRLVVRPQGDSAFKAEEFGFEVFPAAAPARLQGKVLLFDPAGETMNMLARASVEFEPLTAGSDLENASCVIVGKKSYGARFLDVAAKTRLESAVTGGLNLLVFEQTAPEVLGVKLTERSPRHVFVADPGSPLLAGLKPADLVNLRGQSDLVEPYPEALPETEKKWPARFYKWGNRGVTATFTCTRPHYSPLLPVLECGFDLVDSPLLQGRFGRGTAVLCQVDVTSRYGTDPVSTRLVHNLLEQASRRGRDAEAICACLGALAERMARQFGLATGALDQARIILVGPEPMTPEQRKAAVDAVARGATAVLMPGSALDGEFGLVCRKGRFFAGHVQADPLTRGTSASDVFFKNWMEAPVTRGGEPWRVLVEPGLLAERRFGAGRVLACAVAPHTLRGTRAGIKTIRCWNALLANLGASRIEDASLLAPRRSLYEDNAWEQLPPYMNW